MSYGGDHQCAHWSADDDGGSSRGFRTCMDNPGHKDFLTIQEFRDKGASLYPYKEDLDDVWNFIHRTVRVRVSYTSKHRPDTYSRSNIPYPLREYRGSDCRMRSGTGCLYCSLKFVTDDELYKKYVDMYKPCPCLDCNRKTQSQESKSNSKFSAYFIIETATHVIFDRSEAEKAVFEFDYDTDDRKGVRCVYGVGVLDDEEDRLNTDLCSVVCVTHDDKLADYLHRLCIRSDWPIFMRPCFMVSHPHGVSKRISFGEPAIFTTYAYQKGEFPITLKKGLPVRVSGSRNNTDMVKFLNRVGGDDGLNLSDGGKIGILVRNDDEHKTFRLSSDIIISSPFGIILHAEIEWGKLSETEWSPSGLGPRWWTVAEDTEFVSDSGSPAFSLPHSSDHDRNGVKFKFYIEEVKLEKSQFLRTSDAINHPRFKYKGSYGYTMASCSGSSGAFVHRPFMPTDLLGFECVHFGRAGNYNKTGLGDFGHRFYVEQPGRLL